MKDKIKKNKKIVLLCSGILVIAVLAVSISLLTREDEFADSNLDPASISKIHIKMQNEENKYSADEFVIEQQENIEKVIGFIKKMAESEFKTSINGVYPTDYDFTYYFKNGKSEKYTHGFLAVTSDDGFESIFRLKEVIPQINYVFTTKYEDIIDVKMYLWLSEDAVEPVEYFFTDKKEIEEILKFGQENMLEDLSKSNTTTPLGVEFYVNPAVTSSLFAVNISPDMYKYDELCEKVPKVKEFAEMIGK